MLSKEFSSSQLSAKMNFSFGNKLAQVMIICEPPGRREITENVIYSGDRGLILKKMYEAIGLSIKGDNLYVVPVFPWRLSPDPVKAENDMRKFFCCVKKHVSIVRPKVLVLMYKGWMAMSVLESTRINLMKSMSFTIILKNLALKLLLGC